MRLFFGLSLPQPVRDEVSRCASACRDVIPGRYVLQENYHVTLAFLGDVPQARITDAEGVLAASLQDFCAPRLTLGELSYFGRAHNAIIIARVHSEPALDPLHDALIMRLRAAGLPADFGPFSPHITLARHAAAEGVSFPSCAALSFVPSHAHLFLSARDECNILRYTPLKTVHFASAPDGSR